MLLEILFLLVYQGFSDKSQFYFFVFLVSGTFYYLYTAQAFALFQIAYVFD